MNVTLTLEFDSLHALQEYLRRDDSRQMTINFNDRPDTGVSADEKAAVLAPVNPLAAFNPFAGLPTTVAAGAAVAQVPPPPPAPSTAVAEAPTTAPATSAPPVPAPSVPAPPSVPAAVAPAVPAAPPSPAGIEVDADGLPWDARIHAGGRAKNADGRWRQKRGLNDEALKKRVEAELRQAMGAAASVPVVPPVVAPTAVAPSPATTAPSSIPAPAVVPTPPPAAAEEAPPQFLARVGGMLASGALTQDRLNAALASAGLSTMAQLIVAPTLMPLVRAQIDGVPT